MICRLADYQRVSNPTWAEFRTKFEDDVLASKSQHTLASSRGIRFQILVRGMNWRDDHPQQCYLLARELGP